MEEIPELFHYAALIALLKKQGGVVSFTKEEIFEVLDNEEFLILSESKEKEIYYLEVKESEDD